jgi:hypothetical protein
VVFLAGYAVASVREVLCITQEIRFAPFLTQALYAFAIMPRRPARVTFDPREMDDEEDTRSADYVTTYANARSFTFFQLQCEH